MMRVVVHFVDSDHREEMEIPVSSNIRNLVERYCEQISLRAERIDHIEIASRDAEANNPMMIATAILVNNSIDIIIKNIVQEGMSPRQAANKVSRATALSEERIWIQTVIPTVGRKIERLSLPQHSSEKMWYGRVDNEVVANLKIEQNLGRQYHTVSTNPPAEVPSSGEAVEEVTIRDETNRTDEAMQPDENTPARAVSKFGDVLNETKLRLASSDWNLGPDDAPE